MTRLGVIAKYHANKMAAILLKLRSTFGFEKKRSLSSDLKYLLNIKTLGHKPGPNFIIQSIHMQSKFLLYLSLNF